MPTPTSQPNRVVVPPPYNQSGERTCQHLVRIHKECGSWPWELFEGRSPTRWGHNAANKLALAIVTVSSESSATSLPELVERLMEKIDATGNGKITYTICNDALDWVRENDRTRRVGSTISTRSTRPGPNDPLEISRNDQNEDIETPALSSTSPPEPMSRPKRALRAKTSATSEGPPQKQIRKADNGAQRGNNRDKNIPRLGLEVRTEIEPEANPSRHLEPEAGMEMDLDLEPSNASEEIRRNAATSSHVGNPGNATHDRPITESMLRLEATSARLKDYKRELETEEPACASLDTTIASTKEAIINANKQLDDAKQKVAVRQTDLSKIQDVAKSLNNDLLQASMNKTIEDARHSLKEAIKDNRHAKNELDTQQEKLNKHRDARKALRGYIKMLRRNINRCKEDIDTETKKRKVLFLTRDLHYLSPDGLERIFDAGLPLCLELMLKIQDEKG